MEKVMPLKTTYLSRRVKKALPRGKFLLFPYFHFVAKGAELVREAKEVDKKIKGCYQEFISTSRETIIEEETNNLINEVMDKLTYSAFSLGWLEVKIKTLLEKFNNEQLVVILIKKEVIKRILSLGSSLREFTKEIKRGKTIKALPNGASLPLLYGAIKANKNAGCFIFSHNLNKDKIVKEFLGELNSTDNLLAHLFSILSVCKRIKTA